MTRDELYEKIPAKWSDKHFVSTCELFGKTIASIAGAEEDNDIIWIVCSDGSEYIMYHEQDCCEGVYINSVDGPIECLVGHPLTMAEEVTSSDEPLDGYGQLDKWDESYTWTFYKFATVKGYVTIRWYGTSNGYYSEGVDLIKIK